MGLHRHAPLEAFSRWLACPRRVHRREGRYSCIRGARGSSCSALKRARSDYQTSLPSIHSSRIGTLPAELAATDLSNVLPVQTILDPMEPFKCRVMTKLGARDPNRAADSKKRSLSSFKMGSPSGSMSARQKDAFEAKTKDRLQRLPYDSTRKTCTSGGSLTMTTSVSSCFASSTRR